jgi:iron(III) transport system ATP-binding protein
VRIEISGIEKRFGTLQALYPLDLTINDGEFISLLGPSGCGKTTILRMIAGLETPDDGEIRFGDELIFSKKERKELSPQKRNIGMVFQDFALWPHMNVFDNVAYSLRARGVKENIESKVKEALENVQLEKLADRYPHQLSGGQQQRVAFARAVANNPPVILLDEPLSALDAALRDDMRILLQSLVKKLGITTVYVTHDQSEAMAMSDRIVVMNQGRKMQYDTPESIYHKPVNETVAAFVGRGTLLQGMYTEDQKGGRFIISETDQSFPVQSAGGSETKASLTAIIRPEQITLVPEKTEGSIKTIVKNCSYLGERYELLLEIQGSNQQLFSYSNARLSAGEKVFCTISPEEIHIIQQNEGDMLYETV